MARQRSRRSRLARPGQLARAGRCQQGRRRPRQREALPHDSDREAVVDPEGRTGGRAQGVQSVRGRARPHTAAEMGDGHLRMGRRDDRPHPRPHRPADGQPARAEVGQGGTKGRPPTRRPALPRPPCAASLATTRPRRMSSSTRTRSRPRRPATYPISPARGCARRRPAIGTPSLQ